MAENSKSEDRLSPREQVYLQVTKEIAVKFIETGRLTAASFGENFQGIYHTVKRTVEGRED